jgi:hypothetical protein
VDRRGVGLGTDRMLLPCATIAKSGHVVRYYTGTRLQVFLTFLTIDILDKKALREVKEKFANSQERNKCGNPDHIATDFLQRVRLYILYSLVALQVSILDIHCQIAWKKKAWSLKIKSEASDQVFFSNCIV